jgi:hypothetical protein
VLIQTGAEQGGGGVGGPLKKCIIKILILNRHVLTWHAKGARSLQCLTLNSAVLFSLEIYIWMQFPVEFKILGWSLAHAMFSTNLLVAHEINSLPLLCTSDVQYFAVYFQFQPEHTVQRK